MVVGGTDRISVDTVDTLVGGYLLSVASLQRLIDAHDQRTSFWHECL